MSEASRITQTWRDTKEKEEWGRLDVWIPIETINQYKSMAKRRGQKLSQCLVDAAVALAGLRGEGRTTIMRDQELKRMEERITERVLARYDLASHAPAHEEMYLNEHNKALPKGIRMAIANEPPPPGMKLCDCDEPKHWRPITDDRCRGGQQRTKANRTRELNTSSQSRARARKKPLA